MNLRRSLFHRRRGIGGKVLVLQHGFLGSSRYWEPQIDAFSTDFDVIAPDLPGFGGSRNMPGETSMSGLARAVVACLDELGVKHFILVGHSMGGAVAQQIALDFGSRIERLVLYGTSCSGTLPERFESFDQSIARLRSQGVAAHAERVIPTWFVDGANSTHYETCRRAADDMALEAAVLAQEAISRWSVCAQLSQVRIPTMVIAGDRDRSCSPNEAYRLWQSIPDARLCIMPNCAHAVHLERPELFNRILKEFLQDPVRNDAATHA
jgi:2-hydroxy-6-oxonona-2,4-dienedioate hydrolase